MNLDELRASGRATIKPAEAFQVVDVGRNRGMKALKSGEIPGLLRVGGRNLVSVPALLKWLSADDD